MSETVQAMPVKFAMKIVRLKVYIIFSLSDDFALHSPEGRPGISDVSLVSGISRLSV